MNQFYDKSFINDQLIIDSGFVPYKFGLVNLGNSCYANSVLNCLFGDEEIAHLVLNSRNQPIFRMRGNELIKNFYGLMNASFGNEEVKIGSGVSKLMEMVYKKSGLFEKGVQSDAHEFLLYVLNAFKESFEKGLPKVYPNQRGYKNIFDEFQIGLNQITICENDHRKFTADKTILSLDIAGYHTIDDCLNNFFKSYDLQKCICSPKGFNHNPKNNLCNSYKCEQCQLHVAAKQTYAVTCLPKNLVLHLKRFSFNGREVCLL